MEKQQRDFWSWTLLPETEQDKKCILQNAIGCVQRIHELLPMLRDEISNQLEQVLDTEDVEFCQFILLMCIPHLQDFTAESFQHVPERRRARFMQRLVYCRQNLLDGLRADQCDCETASEVQYTSLRAFVWDMRMTYLIDTCSSGKQDSGDQKSSDTSSRLPADWSSETPCTSENVLVLYFTANSLLLHFAYMCDYTDFQPFNQPPLALRYASHPAVAAAVAAPTSNEKKEALKVEPGTTTAATASEPPPAVVGIETVYQRTSKLPLRTLTTGHDVMRGLQEHTINYFQFQTRILAAPTPTGV
jgi:hypothetical protein